MFIHFNFFYPIKSWVKVKKKKVKKKKSKVLKIKKINKSKNKVTLTISIRKTTLLARSWTKTLLNEWTDWSGVIHPGYHLLYYVFYISCCGFKSSENMMAAWS